MTAPSRGRRLDLWLLKLLRLGDRRPEVESDLTELFEVRSRERGRGYAWRRLIVDMLSVASMPRRGTLGQDLRFGLRLIRKHPAPVGITVAGLALAIAVVTGTFGIINATLLRPYKMADPSSVVSIHRPGPNSVSAWPYTQFLHWQHHLRLTTVEASLVDDARIGLTAASDDATPAYVMFASDGYLPMLGGHARIGRTLELRDDVPGAPLVAVVSQAFWTTHLNSEASIVGRTIWIGRAAVTVVGVMDPDFVGPTAFRAACWTPLAAYGELTHSRALTPTSNEFVDIAGRLAPGVSIAKAANELAAVSAGMLNWQGDPDRTARAARLVSARSPWAERDADERYGALAMLAVAGLVLILACANAANLLLAGAASRAREMGVRLALGATRGRLVRQLVSESLLLGLISGAFGFVLSIWLMRIGAALLSLPPDVHVTPDLRVLFFAAGVALASGLGASLAPARYGAGGDVLTALKMQSGQRHPAARTSRARLSFVGLQAAVSIFLLVGAALMTRSAIRVAGTDLGFDADKLLSVSLDIPRSPAYYDRTAGIYNDNARAYLAAAISAVRALPSVENASLALYPPFGFSRATTRPFTHDGRSYAVYGSVSDAAYFATAGFRIVRGRAFTDDEAKGAAPVVLISESVARDFFDNGDPIGRVLGGVRTPFGHDAESTVIGVVADAMTTSPEADRNGTLYGPIGSRFDNPPTLVVRTAHPAAIARAVETTLVKLNPGVRPTSRVIGAVVERFLDNKRTMATTAAIVAGLACVLALLGVYGVTAFVLGQRTQEIGVRMAFGATSSDVFGLLVRQSLRPVILGLAVGLAAALGSTQVLASLLSGLSPHDPISIGLAVGVLLVGALAAVIAPARLAARTDPAGVLRST